VSKSRLEARFRVAWRALAEQAPAEGAPSAGVGTPAYEEEYRFHPERQWAFDFAWPDYQVAVEIDGGQWSPHGGRHSRDSDREKLNAAAVLGWRVLRYSGTMLNDPQAVVDEVMNALQWLRRGHISDAPLHRGGGDRG